MGLVREQVRNVDPEVRILEVPVREYVVTATPVGRPCPDNFRDWFALGWELLVERVQDWRERAKQRIAEWRVRDA